MPLEIVNLGASMFDARNNTITIQAKRLQGEDEADALDLGPCPVWFSCGFFGAPMPGSQGLYDTETGEIVAIRDIGAGEYFGLFYPGESLQYGPAGNFVRCKRDGSVTLFTTDDGTFDGKSIYCQVYQGGIRAVTPWGKFNLGADGFHVLHSSGARIDLGSVGGLPAPLDSLGSYVKIAAAIAQIEASAVSIGTATGASEPAAKALAVLTALSSISTALASIQVSLSAITAIPAVSGAAGATTATGVIVAATVSTLAASAATVPSGSMQVT